jgi:hypothetical protein
VDKEKAKKTKPAPAPGANSKKALWAGLAIIAAAGAAASYFLLFSPAAQYKRAFKHAVSAIEKKKKDPLAEFISDNYSDEAGNTKQSLLGTADTLFGGYDRIKVRIKRLDVGTVKDGSANLDVEGSVYFFSGNETYRYKTEGPATLFMEKKPGGRRVLKSIAGIRFNLEDIGKTLESVKKDLL